MPGIPWSKPQSPSPKPLLETRLATDVAAVMVPSPHFVCSFLISIRPRDPCRFFSKDALPGSLRIAVLGETSWQMLIFAHPILNAGGTSP